MAIETWKNKSNWRCLKGYTWINPFFLKLIGEGAFNLGRTDVMKLKFCFLKEEQVPHFVGHQTIGSLSFSKKNFTVIFLFGYVLNFLLDK